MEQGGLAEITTVITADGHRSIRIGKIRLLDLVKDGESLLIEYKGSRRDPIRASPEQLLDLLDRMTKQQAG